MTFLTVVHIVICLALIGIILLQPGKSDMGIGFGSSSQSIFGSKGAGNFLTKVTTSCAVLFLATSFFLTRMRVSEAERTVIDAVAPTSNTAPKTPVTGNTGAGANAGKPATEGGNTAGEKPAPNKP